MESIIAQERKKYHESLLREGVLTVDKSGVPSNADKSSKLSVSIALGIANRLMAETHDKSVGQTSGAKFEQLNMEFLSNTFPKLQNLRPGTWHITKLGNRNSMKTSSFAQYEHLDYLNRLTAYDRKLAASMGNDYMVAPDVVVYRDTVSDEDINIGISVKKGNTELTDKINSVLKEMTTEDFDSMMDEAISVQPLSE